MRPFQVCITLALPLLVLTGCGDTSPSGEKTPAQIQAETQVSMAQAEANPMFQKAEHYAGSAFDAERERLCRHFAQNPDVVRARPEVNGPDAHIEITVRPGMSGRQLLPLARRIRRYMAAHFKGDRSLIVQEINIHHPGEENAGLTALSSQAGLDNTEGMVGAIVCNGQDETDTKIDPIYHIIQNRKMVE